MLWAQGGKQPQYINKDYDKEDFELVGVASEMTQGCVSSTSRCLQPFYFTAASMFLNSNINQFICKAVTHKYNHLEEMEYFGTYAQRSWYRTLLCTSDQDY